MTTGQRIKAARKNNKLTQKELAAKLGIAYQTLAQWENDLRNPKPDTLRRIAAALNVPLMELMELTSAEREQLERDALSQNDTNRLVDALEASDEAVIAAFQGISDANIKKHLLAIVEDELTREGQILILKRAYELSMQQRYSHYPIKRKTPRA